MRERRAPAIPACDHDPAASSVPTYSLYGLCIASELTLPELPTAPPTRAADVQVRLGTAAPGFSDEELHAIEDAAGFRIEGVATYLIRGGSEIVVVPARGAPGVNVRLYLLGSALGMLLHQRGVLPLHASAVDIGGRAFAFMGPPGVGKSTLAASLERRAHPVIADDVCAVRLSGAGEPWVSPGLPRLRLWRNSLEALGLEASDYPRSYAGDERYDKFDVPLGSAAGEPLPLGAVFVVIDGPRVAVERLGGAAAVMALVENIYRGSWAAGSLQRHWESCLAIAARVPVLALERPRNLTTMSGLAADVVALCHRLVREDPIAEPASEP